MSLGPLQISFPDFSSMSASGSLAPVSAGGAVVSIDIGGGKLSLVTNHYACSDLINATFVLVPD
jgi:hypothetical protein